MRVTAQPSESLPGRRAWLCTLMLAPLALPAVAGCGGGLPTPRQVVQRVSQTMSHLAGYRISGSSQAVTTTTSFKVATLRDGDFQGTLNIAVPGAATFRSQVLATGGKVYVRSPAELQELGIGALPGNLNPATTWVLQPEAVAKSYRASVQPFSGGGLPGTLRRALRGPLKVVRGKLGGRSVLVVVERGGSSSLRLFVSPTSYQLLELAISGSQPISLRYSHFGDAHQVAAPDPADVYVPPSQAPVSP